MPWWIDACVIAYRAWLFRIKQSACALAHKPSMILQRACKHEPTLALLSRNGQLGLNTARIKAPRPTAPTTPMPLAPPGPGRRKIIAGQTLAYHLYYAPQ